jgi:hypothetical protein
MSSSFQHSMLTASVVFALALAFLAKADDPNRLPTKCESKITILKILANRKNKTLFFFLPLKVCKYLTNEIAESLHKHNSHELIETGYSLDDRLKKNHKKYRDS